MLLWTEREMGVGGDNRRIKPKGGQHECRDTKRTMEGDQRGHQSEVGQTHR